MALGLATAIANSILNVYRGTAWAGLTVYIKLHTGDPGAAGANNASTVTTRNAATFNAAAAASMTLNTLGTWTMTTTETISHVSMWDASSAGNFLQSAALSVAQSVVNTNTLTLTTFTISYSPIAA
jgi:hypothetical protein